jgi:cytoskeletal protein CcmA (bactofilin family)
MESDKKPEQPAAEASSAGQPAPSDALEKTNDELGLQHTESTTPNAADTNAKPPKQPSKFKQLLKRFNVYLLLFLLMVVIAGAVAIVSILNSKKTPKTPATATQTLNQDTLNKLSNSDATVGDTGQTLTIQGNAIVSGQLLVQKDLNVAGTIKVGGPITLADLTVSNSTNLNTTQTNTLQVAQASTFQGLSTFQNGINVSGGASFTGTVTAGQITVTKLIMSGNATLEVPNHLSFTGASPGRQSIDFNALGNGGSASINGSDTTGTINFHTGAGPTPGCYITITFNRPFSSTPHVIISPVGSAAGSMDYYVNNRTTTGFQLCSNNAPAASQAFAFDYFITD